MIYSLASSLLIHSFSFPHTLHSSLPPSLPHSLSPSLFLPSFSPSLSLPSLTPSLSPSLSLFSFFPHTLTLSLAPSLLHPSLPNLSVDKLALILHFMPGGMEGLTLNNWKPHKYIKLTLAYGFCQMVRLIQSKDSIVITRVQYCLGNLRKKSIEVSFVQWWSPDNHVTCDIFIWQYISLLSFE